MKTVLVYVLSSGEHPFPLLARTSLGTWDSVVVPGVETMFFSNRVPEYPKLVCLDVPESLMTMGRKCLLAYKWALENKQWDYMARVNASCYVRKAMLADYCQSLPGLNLFRGVMTGKADSPDAFMWGGAHYIMSRDVVKLFVDNADKWDHSTMEDVSMTRLARRLGIPLDGTGRAASINKKPDHWLCLCFNGKTGGFEFRDFAEMKKLDDQHFIRVKQDGARHLDVHIMNELHKAGV